MDIKPIETVYNGYRFRSRLEARWAVFFDTAGIKYEYEPEGFELCDGTRYLPDFYLTDEDIYVEVKPIRNNATEEIMKALKIVLEYQKVLLVLRDIPFNERCSVWWFPIYFYHPVLEDISGCRISFLPNAEHEKIRVCRDFYVGNECRLYSHRGAIEREAIAINDIELEPKSDSIVPFTVRDCWDGKALKNCFLAARQARFEHGETPNVRSVAL